MANTKLNPAQWETIRVQYIENHASGRQLARQFGISETAIRKRFGSQAKLIKNVVNQCIEAENALHSLDESSQLSAQKMINTLRAVASHLTHAALNNSRVAAQLSALANRQVQTLYGLETQTNDSTAMDRVKDTVMLVDASNKASQLGLALIKANQLQITPPEEDATRAFLESLNGRMWNVSDDDDGRA